METRDRPHPDSGFKVDRHRVKARQALLADRCLVRHTVPLQSILPRGLHLPGQVATEVHRASDLDLHLQIEVAHERLLDLDLENPQIYLRIHNDHPIQITTGIIGTRISWPSEPLTHSKLRVD
jgi:hypothetical protein